MSPAELSGEPALSDYLKVLRRRFGVMLVAVLIAVGVSVGSSLLQTPIYRATSEVALQTPSTERIFDQGLIQPSDPARLLNTQIRTIESRPVRDLVVAILGPVPKVSATPVGQTDVISVAIRSTDAKRAVVVANAYANSYIEFRRTQAVDEVLAAVKQVQERISALQVQIDQAAAGQKEPIIQQQAAFRQQLDQLQVAQALERGGVQLVNPAATPTTPVTPRPLRSGLIALFLGLLLGGGLAFLVDYLDDSVKSKQDVEKASGLPTLGLIPVVTGWRSKGVPLVVSTTDPRSPAAEAYRTLRTGIQFLNLDRPNRTLQVTSSNAGEGKTTTLANLGVALARSGQRVVLVCCDLRRPRIHEFFGLDNEVGFTSVLLGKVSLAGALQRVPDDDNLRLLASGPLPPNPSELLSSARTAEVLTLLQVDADIVLVDSPPVLPVTDALVLSGRVDSTLLVCASGAISRKDLARSVELLAEVDAPVVGTVLNGITSDISYGYVNQYYQYEKSEHAGDTVKGRKR